MQTIASLGQEKIGRLLIRYSTPAIAGLLVYGLGRLIGNIFIGRLLGATALAGFTVANSVTMLLLACTLLIGTGTSVVISIRLGARRLDEARQILGAAYLASLLGGICLMLAGWLCLEPMLWLFGAQGAVLTAAADYTRVLLPGSSFMLLNNVLNSTIRAEGHPLKALLTNVASFVISVALMPVFLMVFPMGMAGMALAGVLSSIIMTAWLTAHFRSRNTVLRLRFTDLRWNSKLLRPAIKIGLAPFTLQITAAILSILTNHIAMANGGEDSVAVKGVVTTIYFLLLMPLQGTGIGIQPIIGFNHGAGLRQRVRKTVWLALCFTGVLALTAFILVLLYRESLPGIFLSNQTAIHNAAGQGLLLVLLALPVTGIRFVGTSLFQATGRASLAIATNLFRPIVMVVPMLTLPLFWGLNGLFISYSLAELIMAAVVGLMIRAEFRSKTPDMTGPFDKQ